jgi:hypothetical protein
LQINLDEILEPTKTSKLYGERKIILGFAIFFFVCAGFCVFRIWPYSVVPLAVTGSYYSRWEKKYDVVHGCDGLPQVNFDRLPIKMVLVLNLL